MQWPVQLLRKPDTHKGNYGHVLVLGGSVGLTGAVCLAASAALKIGSGLVTVGIPRLTNSIFEIKLTEVMSFPLSDNRGYIIPKALNEVKQILNKINSIVLGPGASLKTCTRRFILKILEQIDKPMVIDADAINVVADDIDVLKHRKAKNLVLTPHLGEFSRLIKLDKDNINRDRKELVKDFSLRYNLVLVLKGYHTLVGYNGEVFENSTGNPGMATAGAGDVLSGIISGLIAQKLDCFEASKLGVYLHGLAGDLAAKDKTENCLIASDIIEYLPQAIKLVQS